MIELVLKLLSTVFSFILNIFTSKNVQDDFRREQAELEASDLREELNALHELGAEHERQILKAIDPNLTDEEASRMLSEDLDDEDHTIH